MRHETQSKTRIMAQPGPFTSQKSKLSQAMQKIHRQNPAHPGTGAPHTLYASQMRSWNMNSLRDLNPLTYRHTMEQQTLESGLRTISSTYIWLEEMISTPLNIYPLSLKGQLGTGLKAFPKTQSEVGKSSRTLSEQTFKGPTSVPRMLTTSVT